MVAIEQNHFQAIFHIDAILVMAAIINQGFATK
jgi:hypothetical protein